MAINDTLNQATEEALPLTLNDLLFQKGIDSSVDEDTQRKIEELLEENEKLKEERESSITEKNNLKEVISRLDKKNSLSPDVLFKKAVENLKEENYIDALGLLQAALLLDPENIKVMNNLAVVYCEFEYYDKAKETLKCILEIDPENELAKRNLETL